MSFAILLSMKKIILASQSPRRKALLEQIGLVFEIVVSDYEEKPDHSLPPHKIVQQLSLGKAKSVAQHHKEAIIIGADTIVTFDGKVIGKPKDKADAIKTLRLLSNNTHVIITGLSIIDATSGKCITKSVKTSVKMKKLTEHEIQRYTETKEPLDKAGSYGIQEKGAVLIERISGDYSNVVGLPIPALVRSLKHMNISIEDCWKNTY